MKKQISIFLACCLLAGSLCGCGKENGGSDVGGQVTSYEKSTLDEGTDLRTGLNVPKSFQDTWKSNSGITVVTVDAEVQFPESVSKAPVIEVASRAMTKEDLFAFCDAAFEGKKYDPYFYDQDANDYYKVPKDQLEFSADPFLAFYFDGEEKVFSSYYQDYLPAFSATVEIRELNNLIRFSHVYADSGSRYDHDKALAYAKELVDSFSPGLECVKEDKYTISVPSTDNDDGGDEQEQVYEFIFNRPYAGISTTYTMLECTENDGNPEGYAPSSYYESVTVDISETQLWQMQWRSPYEQIGIINENPKLMSFDEITQVASKMLPLKWAYHEQTWKEETSKNMEVGRITFGYTRVLMKDAPTRYMMVPVWDFFGVFEATGDAATEEPLLTLNAIDGSVIDREYGY